MFQRRTLEKVITVRQQNTVVRDRLLTKLSTAPNYRLTLVASPAGYGKTTLVAHWAAGKSDLGWYSLDESDNQPERFASYLIAAVQQACGGHCVKSEALSQKHQYASLSALFAQLFVELSDWHRPLLLVIDDYHLISNDAIHEGMRFFLRHQPENLSLVVLSRTLPPLGIANMRVRDQVERPHRSGRQWPSVRRSGRLGNGTPVDRVIRTSVHHVVATVYAAVRPQTGRAECQPSFRISGG